MRPVRARCTLLKDAGAPYAAGAGAIYSDSRTGAAQTKLEECTPPLALVGTTRFAWPFLRFQFGVALRPLTSLEVDGVVASAARRRRERRPWPCSQPSATVATR